MHFFPAIALCLASVATTCQQPGSTVTEKTQTVLPQSLPDAPEAPAQTLLLAATAPKSAGRAYSIYPSGAQQSSSKLEKSDDLLVKARDLDENGDPIDLNRQQPRRILGFMPNFRTVSAGSKPHPPGWKYNFGVATRQSFDYSSFIFLGLTSISAEALDEHPKLGKGVKGMYEYTWRGLLDKTDGTYLGAWLLPSLLHEDTRYYPMGYGHSIPIRALYVISRQAVARTYGGHQTPNIAGLGGKMLTQVISRNYYPAGTSDFSALAEKFAYAAMRDIIFTSIREFYPDIAAHFIRKHRENLYREQAALQPVNP